MTPLGVILTAGDLILAIWANVALGLYLSFRPGTTSAASSRTGMATLALFVFHLPLLFATLASPRELAMVATWDVRIRWALILVGLAIPILTGAIAWWLTRRTLNRFDQWVDRPNRGPGKPADAP